MTNPTVTNVDGTNTGPNVVTSPVAYLGGGGPYVIGSYASATVAFYGATPVAQRAYASSVHATAALASSAAFGASQAAILTEVMNTLIGLGVWATA